MSYLDLKKIQPTKKNKTGGVVTSTVMGIGGLVIGTIIILIVVQTLTNANLLGTATTEAYAVSNMTGNFTQGIGNVSSKLPTILLIVAVVFLFGALALLVKNAKSMGVGGDGGSL